MRLMKDSGIDYLGDIPVDWDVKPHWAYLKEKKDPVGAMHDQLTLLSLTKRGVIVRDLEAGGKFPSNFEGYQKVEKGDLILCLFDVKETPRTVGLAPSSGMITSAYTNMEVRDIDNRFIEWYLIAMDDEKRFKPFYSGLRNTIPKPIFSSIRFSVPDSLEQKQIADYLDQETSKIDLLISKKEQLIEKLLERRQALIAQVVTKGLDPSVPMKDSGIEWVGKVPQTWRLEKLAAACELRSGYSFDSDNFELEGDFPVIRMSDLTGAKSRVFLNYEPHNVPSSVWISDGDIVLGMTGDYNAIIWNNGSALLNQRLASLRFADKEIAKFAIFPLKVALGYANQTSLSTTIRNLSLSELKNIRLPMPPREELNNLLFVLSGEVDKIDNMINAVRMAVELLLERRQTLITQVVTGKLDVRG